MVFEIKFIQDINHFNLLAHLAMQQDGLVRILFIRRKAQQNMSGLFTIGCDASFLITLLIVDQQFEIHYRLGFFKGCVCWGKRGLYMSLVFVCFDAFRTAVLPV